MRCKDNAFEWLLYYCLWYDYHIVMSEIGSICAQSIKLLRSALEMRVKFNGRKLVLDTFDKQGD